MLRTSYCLLLALLTMPVYAVGDVASDDPDNEFLELDLEQLLATKVDPHLASVLESHIHRREERMLSIMRTSRDKRASSEDTELVLNEYPMAPTDMQSESYLVSGMFAWSDRGTAMVMIPFEARSMDNTAATGEITSDRVSGVGDITLMANYVVKESASHRLIIQTAASIPTGSIDERGVSATGAGGRLPYAMQLGSGTLDVRPGLMYQFTADPWSLGLQATADVRFGKNSNSYRLGNRLDLKAWLAHEWTPFFASVLKLGFHDQDPIEGADPELDAALTPAANPRLVGGQSLDAHVVTELYTSSPRAEALRLSLDIGFPLREKHAEPHLETDWYSTLALQWTF